MKMAAVLLSVGARPHHLIFSEDILVSLPHELSVNNNYYYATLPSSIVMVQEQNIFLL
jgi:hypothetical protein